MDNLQITLPLWLIAMNISKKGTFSYKFATFYFFSNGILLSLKSLIEVIK